MIVLIEVKRKNEERFDVMLRRFNREVQQSGILSVAKEKRHFKKEDNRGKIRKSAIRKRYIQSLKRGY